MPHVRSRSRPLDLYSKGPPFKAARWTIDWLARGEAGSTENFRTSRSPNDYTTCPAMPFLSPLYARLMV